MDRPHQRLVRLEAKAFKCLSRQEARKILTEAQALSESLKANVSDDQWRVGLHAGFCKGWLRAEENFQLTVPLEVARELPERAQYLLGFRSYSPEFGGRLGLVDYDDAARLLR